MSAFIVLMMEAVSTFETSVTFYETTQRNIPEDSHVCVALAIQQTLVDTISLLLAPKIHYVKTNE
jgi:hypothetical protein